MTFGAYVSPEGLQRAWKLGRLGPKLFWQDRDDGITKLLKRAAEDLAGGLEFGPQAQKTELLVL